MPGESLNVIALISGGKDSFYSLLHCLRNGNRVVALANLYPGTKHGDGSEIGNGTPVQVEVIDASTGPLEYGHGLLLAPDGGEGSCTNSCEVEQDTDLNSFMYQTVGHQLIPLYAAATGIPLYRRQITGRAVQDGRDYDGSRSETGAGTGGVIPPEKRGSSKPGGQEQGQGQEREEWGGEGKEAAEDETESMLPLLREVKARHPEANALCAGAILSTYQRTRVESVATRLGLTPLAYLWKFPVLPPPSPPPPRERTRPAPR